MVTEIYGNKRHPETIERKKTPDKEKLCMELKTILLCKPQW